jgi:uncharacterized protein YprB with RNaseH-like and TPR domain
MARQLLEWSNYLKVTFFDTESTDLTANWGRLLCASFCGFGDDVVTYRKDVKPFIGRNKVDDARLALAIRDELEGSDMIVGWNSILHDLPLVNARLAAAGERPIRVGERHGVIHVDLMWYAGGQSMKIGGRRLDTVAKFFQCENQKTGLDGETWQLAATGDRVAMDQVVEHCEADVLVLRDVWPHLVPGVKKHQFTLGEVYPFIEQIGSRKA